MQTETTANACYQIPESNLDDLRGKVTKLARRCVKLGLPPLALVEHKAADRICVKYDRETRKPTTYAMACVWCEMTGASPKVGDHTFIARIEHTEAGNLVSRVASNSDEADLDLTAYRAVKATCDHCHTARYRKDTFLLRASDGSIKQIGRNCLADYLRTDSVDLVVAILDLVDLSRCLGSDEPSEDSEGFGGGGWRIDIETRVYLACAVSSVRRTGWVAKSAGGYAMPTASDAMFLAMPCPGGKAAQSWKDGQPTEADLTKAAEILVWVKGTTDPSDYMHNLRVACASEGLRDRVSGIVASAVPAYMRQVEKWEMERAAKLADPGYYAPEGTKIEVQDLTVSFLRYLVGQYGVTTLIGLKGPAGHSFKWFASGSKDLEVGQRVNVKGTVKKCELYKGIHETVLTRCKVEVLQTKEG